jgi:hypothetical protein
MGLGGPPFTIFKKYDHQKLLNFGRNKSKFPHCAIKKIANVIMTEK